MSEIVVEFVVAAGKTTKGRGWAAVDVESGAVVQRADGEPDPPADITFTVTPADAQALHDGALDLSVGFMRGQIKMAGDFGSLLRLLSHSSGRHPRITVADLLPA